MNVILSIVFNSYQNVMLTFYFVDQVFFCLFHSKISDFINIFNLLNRKIKWHLAGAIYIVPCLWNRFVAAEDTNISLDIFLAAILVKQNICYL